MREENAANPQAGSYVVGMKQCQDGAERDTKRARRPRWELNGLGFHRGCCTTKPDEATEASGKNYSLCEVGSLIMLPQYTVD